MGYTMSNGTARLFRATVLSVVLIGLSACSSLPRDEDYGYQVGSNDPLEPLNRGIHEFNYVVDGIAIKPAATLYKNAVPNPVRKGVRNALRNLASPVIVANAAFQGDPDYAFTALWRFVINSTFGIGGIFDVAATQGLVYRNEDFGQTLGTYDVPTGPYLVLPFLGPSNARDAVGIVVDTFIDPMTWLLDNEARVAYTATKVIDARARSIPITDDLEANALDYYSTLRSTYGQYRDNLIRNGEVKE